MRLSRPSGPSRRSAGEDENPYLLSFSDILAALLAIFILALVALMIRLDQQASLAEETRAQVQAALAELARIEELRRELLEEVKRKLELEKIRVEISDNHSVLRIPEEQLHFASGQHAIPADKGLALDTLGRVLGDALLRAKRLSYIETIFIEGHTDSQPLTVMEMGNWGLSAYRAIAVWKYWTESPGNLKMFLYLRNREGKPLFSVSGYADTRRVVEPDPAPEDRQKNRRIDLRFTMRTPVAGDLLQLLEKFDDAGIE
jgi:flagellar motor protein MotB